MTYLKFMNSVDFCFLRIKGELTKCMTLFVFHSAESKFLLKIRGAFKCNI